MNFVAQVEDYLRDLGAEARKKHPGVKEASERAILQLRTLQNQYVTAVRKATIGEASHPTTALFQSQDLLRPFLLAANYPNASPKLLEISLKGMSLLIKGNAICPGDGIHMVRVWTIQANVCATALTSDNKKSHSQSSTTSSSSWFGMLSSSTISSSNDVSSSSGQGALPPKKEASEKLALEILRCLILLLENKELPVTDEQWTASVALCCILGQVSALVVLQAAKTSLHQVLNLFFGQSQESSHAVETWRDLLILASQEPTALRGAFSQCKSSAPSPTLCLELLCRVVRENSEWFRDNLLDMEIESLQVARALLQDTSSISFELVWRSYDFSAAILTLSDYEDENEPEEGDEEEGDDEANADEEDEELKEAEKCRVDLIRALAQGIVRATEACRSNHDFEDGYIYNGPEQATVPSAPNKGKSKNLTTLVPDSLLWRAGLGLETLNLIVEKSPESVVGVAEAVSDFATIGASCRDHMLQLAEISEHYSTKEIDENGDNMKNLVVPSLFRRAEEIQSAALASQKLSDANNPKNLPSTSCDIGEALWTAFDCLLKLSRHVNDEISFAASLAVLQHFLKRFPGSKEIVQSTLVGYTRLAHVVENGDPLQRKALIASLCKLSLPSWGKHDCSTQLQDQHVETLLTILKIVHKYRDNLMEDWYTVLSTMEELSSLNVASSRLSDQGYRKAMIVSLTYTRLAPFTTILSPDSMYDFMEALVEVSKSSIERRNNSMSDYDAVIEDERREGKGKETSESSIGGKFMSFAGKAILGSDKEKGKEGFDASFYAPMKAHRVKTTYGGGYREDFHRRLATPRALHTELLVKVPVSLFIMTDVSLSNIFRFKSCGLLISTFLCKLAGTCQDARAYAMATLSLLVTSQLSSDAPIPASFIGPGLIVTEKPTLSQLLDVKMESDLARKEEISQVDLLSPLCSAIRTTEQAGVAEAGISSLHALLEGSGHNLTGNVWAVVIDAVSSAAGDQSYEIDRTGSEWSTCCMLGFRTLKLIVDDFLEELPPPNDDSSVAPRKSLMECCISYGSSRHDVNTSLTAIGLLWTIADQDVDTTSIERSLEKLVLLAGDSRAEVRNCAVNTLFSCIVGKGPGFSVDQWERTFRTIIFGVYGQVLSRGGNLGKETTENPCDSKGRYKTSVHHSRDSADKQWAATEVLAIRGLNRVLRNNFDELLKTTGQVRLETTKSPSQVVTPWFLDAWSRLLDLALGAAKQGGGRETMELRSSGIDVIVLCCQLSCRAGITAALTPARVGTNMAVINGALRSVGEIRPSSSQERDPEQLPETVGAYKQDMFRNAFNALSSFHQHLEHREEGEEGVRSNVEPVQLQVLQILASGLSKMYECAKSDEFAPSSHVSSDHSVAELFVASDPEVTDESDFEARLVVLVRTVAKKAVGDHSRYLTPAQKVALDLLKEMVANGSNHALTNLAALAGPAFFWTSEDDDSDDGHRENKIDILAREAAHVVMDEINNDLICDETRVQVLTMLLSVFITESDKESWKLPATTIKTPSRKRNYRNFISIMEAGLTSAEVLQVPDDVTTESLLDLLWERVDMVLSQMLSPIHIASHAPYISQASNLAELVKCTVSHAPNARHNGVAALLANGAVKSMEIAKDHGIGAIEAEPVQNDGLLRTSRRKDEALKVCRECIAGLCKLQPDSTVLQSIAQQIFSDVLTSFSSDKKQTISDATVEIAMIACQAIKQSDQMERFVIAMFPQLCLLISVDHTALRIEVASILETVNIGKALEDATIRMQEAERRAEATEKENAVLKSELEELRQENDLLKNAILP